MKNLSSILALTTMAISINGCSRTIERDLKSNQTKKQNDVRYEDTNPFERKDIAELKGNSVSPYEISNEYDYEILPRDINLVHFVIDRIQDENSGGHTTEDLISVIGTKRLEHSDKNELKIFWKAIGPFEKEFFFHAYKNVEDFPKFLPFNYKQQFSKFDLKKINLEEIKDFEDRIPWKFIKENDNYSKSDQAVIYFLKYVSPRLH